MEKKGTKIAYFVALAVVVVALVIAKVTNDAKAFSGKSVPEKKREREARASKKLEAWLKASRMRSF